MHTTLEGPDKMNLGTLDRPFAGRPLTMNLSLLKITTCATIVFLRHMMNLKYQAWWEGYGTKPPRDYMSFVLSEGILGC